MTECFAHFGITIENPRGAWSAQAPNGRAVITLWRQYFTDPDLRRYSTFGTVTGRKPWPWQKRLALMKKVGVGGTFDSIVITAANSGPNEAWRIIRREIGGEMRLTRLDEETGEFAAERVTG